MISPDSIQILYSAIEEQLNRLGLTYQKPSGLSKGILATSEHFIQKKGPSPWTNPAFQASYLAHFLPMNVFRWLKVFERLENLGHYPLSSALDFGAGPMTFRIAYALKYPEKNMDYAVMEVNDTPLKLGESLLSSLGKKLAPMTKYKTSHLQTLDVKYETLILSYSLNELKKIPDEFWSFKNILILEPSMQEVSRELLQVRADALTKNFKALAPCLHSEKCPMLLHSKKDWCFDRVKISIPDMAKPLYKSLPFETKHLTYSYLLLSQNFEPSIPIKSLDEVRAVGDWQKEKGKSKIMVCRSESREFISLLKKTKSDLDTGLSRGDKVALDFDYEIKGNELRIK